MKNETKPQPIAELEGTQSKTTEKTLWFFNRFLTIANRHTEIKALLKEIIAEIQTFVGCGAVGIRLLDDQNNIPYQSYTGFSRKFYESESPLSAKTDQCMCINVITGKTDPKLPFYTKNGSFYMNGTTRFLATISEKEKRTTRNVCNQFGYESVALIPVRINKNILGLIHVADSQENKVPLKMVIVLETIAVLLAMAIRRLWITEKIRESEAKYRTLFDASPLGIGLATLGGKLLTANPQIQKLMGYTKEEIKDINLADIYVNREKRQQLTKLLKKSGSVRDFEVQTKRKDGTIYDVLLNMDIIEIAGQKRILTTIRDITERKKAEAQIRLHSEIMKNMSEAVYLAKMSDATIVYTNPSFEKMFGYAPGEMIGKHISIINAPTNKTPRETATEITAFIKKHGCWDGEINNIKKDGTTFWCHVTVSVFEHAVHKKVLISVRTNITERKKAEKRIREQSRALTQKNIALKEVLEQISLEKTGLARKITANLEELVIPKLQRLKRRISDPDKKRIDLLEKDIKNIASSFGIKVSSRKIALSPREIEVCDLIKNGFKNKAIAGQLTLTPATIATIRKSIRRKLKLRNKQVNLITFLQSL